MATPRSASRRPEPQDRPPWRPPSRAPSGPASSRRRPPSPSPPSSLSSSTMTTPRSAIRRPEPEPRPPWRPPSRVPTKPASSRRRPLSSSPSAPSLTRATPRSAIEWPEPEPRPPSRAPSQPASSRPPSSSTSAVAAESLPQDIIIEVLSRLPIKSLMRLKCVCRRWRSLISDPGFAKWHLQRLKAGDTISSLRILKTFPIGIIDYEVLDNDRVGIKFRHSRIDDGTWEPIIVGSCDGLVCLDVIGGFVLYNPTIEEFRKIPISDIFLGGEFFVFGYDPASNDYKVAVGEVVGEGASDDCNGVVCEGSQLCEVGIFSLKSGYWRRIQVQQESHLDGDHKGVYWKGALHWCGIDEGRKIMSFDLSEEIFHQVLLVPEWNGDIIYQGLDIHGANLLMYTSNDYWFMAWIMNELGRKGTWTKLFSFSAEGMPGSYLQMPIVYTRRGKIIFEVDFFDYVLFNPEDNTYKDSPISRAKLAIYVETLVSPYLGCEPSRI